MVFASVETAQVAELGRFPDQCGLDVWHVKMLMNDPNLPTVSARSHLFTVRVWLEARQDASSNVRMQVKHVLSGAMRTCSEWSQVVAFITARLEENEDDPLA